MIIAQYATGLRDKRMEMSQYLNIESAYRSKLNDWFTLPAIHIIDAIILLLIVLQTS